MKTKVIDAGVSEKSYPKTGKEIKSQYLMNAAVKIKPSSKGARASEVFSPLMQYMKDAKPVTKKKYSAKRQNGFKTQQYSRGEQSSIGNHFDPQTSHQLNKEQMDRAVTSLSPEFQSQRPRKILLASALNPELTVASSNARSIMNKIKENLNQISKLD